MLKKRICEYENADEKLREINYANIRNKNMSEKKIKNMRKIMKKKDCWII